MTYRSLQRDSLNGKIGHSCAVAIWPDVGQKPLQPTDSGQNDLRREYKSRRRQMRACQDGATVGLARRTPPLKSGQKVAQPARVAPTESTKLLVLARVGVRHLVQLRESKITMGESARTAILRCRERDASGDRTIDYVRAAGAQVVEPPNVKWLDFSTKTGQSGRDEAGRTVPTTLTETCPSEEHPHLLRRSLHWCVCPWRGPLRC